MDDHDMDDHDMDHHGTGDYDKMHRLEEMIEKFCGGMEMDEHDMMHKDMDHDMDHDKDHDRMLAGHEAEDKDHDDHDESDHDMDHDESDHDDMHHGDVKDMWLCMQAKQMAWDLKEYMHGDEHDRMRQSRGWMRDIEEMKREWGMDGASNLAMAGAAMIVAVSALSF